MATTTTRRAGASKPAPLKAADKPVWPEWLGPSELMDFGDPALLATARSIANRGKTEAARALHAHAKVRAMPLAFHRQSRPTAASEILRRRNGDAIDKATLLVALLRLCGLPARVMFAPAPAEALRGLPVDVSAWPRPMVEVRIEGEWLLTDAFIFDERYVRAAHYRLHQKHRDSGYGVAAGGAVNWDAKHSMSTLGDAYLQNFDGDATRYDDAAEFAKSLGVFGRVAQLGRWALWSTQRGRLERAVRGLRARQPGPQPRETRAARRSRLPVDTVQG